MKSTMNTPPPEERERLRALYEKATPGPWHGYSLYAILRFARKNSGAWEECPDGQNCPTDDDSDLIVAMHDALPSILHTLDTVEQERERLRHERDQAVEEANRRDQKWMDGIDAIVGRKLRYTLATITDAPGFDLVPDLQDFIQSLRDELAASKEREQGLREELEFIKAHSAIPAPNCNYLSPAGMTCFKCGRVHSGTKLALALSAQLAPLPQPPTKGGEV